jgi:ribosomal protein S18 acetylase RimI-like enzyme
MSGRNGETGRVSPEYTIRDATRADIEVLIDFTLQEAREAEGLEADVENVRRDVHAAFENPPLAAYWVAETQDGRVGASTSVITERSDFHGRYYWWVQSLFIAPERRGGGPVDGLLDHLTRAAEASGALELRLYVHSLNDRAHRAYRRYGFKEAPSSLMKRGVQPDSVLQSPSPQKEKR